MMKIKCNDGVVRRFMKAYADGEKISFSDMIQSAYAVDRAQGYHDSFCIECGHNFGCHDLKVLKPEWRKHKCRAGRLLSAAKKALVALTPKDKKCGGCYEK